MIKTELINQWLELYGQILADKILEFQNKYHNLTFHIDHIVPLISLPDEYVVDISSLAWHPSNLSVIETNTNLVKGSQLDGKNITRKNRTLEDEEKAIKQLYRERENYL